MGHVTTVTSPAPDLATQVARLFFDRQMTKVEIAAHLGISRFRVARLIDGALAIGLVRIEYRDAPAEDRALASAMEERFGLDLCAVADVRDTPDVPDMARIGADALDPVARLAGAVVDGLIGPADVIGVAWGSTMAAVVREIPTRAASGIEVVQLAGGSARLGRDRDAGQLARTLADRLGAADHPIHAPAFVASPTLRDALADDPDIRTAMARFAALTLAIVGVGAISADDSGGPASSLARSGALDDAELARLVAAGAIGDLVVHPFDADGRFVAPHLAARAVAIGVDELRRVPRVVAVAAGTAKSAAIRGAIATGIVDILITDRATARAVLMAD